MQRLRALLSSHMALACGILAALVLTLAAHQIYASKTGTLTPWKGGGFGMYTAPHGNARAVFLMLGDTALRLSPPDPALEVWQETLNHKSAGYVAQMLSQADDFRYFPREPQAEGLIEQAALVRWGAVFAQGVLSPLGGQDGKFDPKDIRVVVTELARQPVAGRLEQQIIFSTGGN